MKKFLIFLLICAAGYFAYEYLIREKPVLEIKADKVISVDNSMDIEAPVLYPPKYGSIQGTVKNITDRVLNNVVLKYQLDAQPVEAVVGSLQPGEQIKFATQTIRVRGRDVPFFLEEMKYE